MRFLAAVVLAGLLASTVRADPSSLAAKAHAVLKTHCAACHGPGGSGKGGFAYVLDRDRLVGRHKVVPGKPSESELYERIRAAEMPPEGKRRPAEAELATLREWIEAGAPAWEPTSPRTFIGTDEVLRLILADLESFPHRQRRFLRYLTLTHLGNAGVAEAGVTTHRHALAKLVNSLSWHARITLPQAIDPGRTIYRIDLRDYRWNARLWDRLAAVYPYRLPDEPAAAKTIAAATGAELAWLRGDWFVATASRPPFYHDFLQLPQTDRALERLLGVDVAASLEEETAARAGFNGSGVSRNNRILERHDSSYGAYWKTYDFSDNTERRNIFEHPLGPAAGGSAFVHDGGEIIFHLPNGLQGYMLTDGRGRRIDRAPVEIVSDPARPDRTVEAGVSCMSCHVKGMIPKADEVRAHVQKNRQAFPAAEAAAVRALYVSETRMKSLMQEDAERFARALAKAGLPAGEPEPVRAVVSWYEGTLDQSGVAAELGLPAKELRERVRHSPVLGRLLGPVLVKGGTVQRSVIVASFAEMMRELPPPGTTRALAEPDVFPGQGGVPCVAVTPDSKMALTGGRDGTLWLWDVATGKPRRPLPAGGAEPGTSAVTAVALSSDGRRAASAGPGRDIRLWDAGSGNELLRLRGHTGDVRALAFAPDGRTLLSAGADGTMRHWDLRSGRELRALVAHDGPVTAIAFTPDGRRAVSGGHDRFVYLWDLSKDRPLRSFDGHTREVYSVAVSPDGRKLASGGNDRTVRLWDLPTGKEVRRFEGHANAVIRVAFLPDGKQLLSGSSKYQTEDKVVSLWDVETGKQLKCWGIGWEVWSSAFSRDGRWAVLGSHQRLPVFLDLSR